MGKLHFVCVINWVSFSSIHIFSAKQKNTTELKPIYLLKTEKNITGLAFLIIEEPFLYLIWIT